MTMPGDERAAGDVSEKLVELRTLLLDVFYQHDACGFTLHPMIVGQIWRMAELLDIPIEDVPTEGRELRLERKP